MGEDNAPKSAKLPIATYTEAQLQQSSMTKPKLVSIVLSLQSFIKEREKLTQLYVDKANANMSNIPSNIVESDTSSNTTCMFTSGGSEAASVIMKLVEQLGERTSYCSKLELELRSNVERFAEEACHHAEQVCQLKLSLQEQSITLANQTSAPKTFSDVVTGVKTSGTPAIQHKQLDKKLNTTTDPKADTASKLSAGAHAAPAFVVSGSRKLQNGNVQAAPRRFSFRINNISTGCEPDHLRSYILNDTGVAVRAESVDVSVIDPPEHITNPTYRCYKVTVPMDLKESFLNPEIWPEGSYVKPYRPRKAVAASDTGGD